MRTNASTPNQNCQHCNVEFKPKSGSVGKFCSIKCKCEKQKHDKIYGNDSMYRCAVCHAALGYGLEKSGQFLNVGKGQISHRLKAQNITRYLPDGGSWQVSAAILRRKEKAWQDAWTSEYNVEFPDWMSVATKYMNNKVSNDYQKRMHRESGAGSLFRMKKIIRTRVYNYIKKSTNAKPRLKNRTTEMLGCSIQEMKNHLQKRFVRGMTWENHGTHWHVDHIIPLCEFDFSNPIQAALATHYTNLQPLWARDNLMKSDRITQTHQLQFL